MATIDSLTSDAELRSMVIDAIAAVASSQTGPVKSATKAADALLIAAAIMIEANPRFSGATGLESGKVTTSDDLNLYLDGLREYAVECGQSLLLSMTQQSMAN